MIWYEKYKKQTSPLTLKWLLITRANILRGRESKRGRLMFLTSRKEWPNFILSLYPPTPVVALHRGAKNGRISQRNRIVTLMEGNKLLTLHFTRIHITMQWRDWLLLFLRLQFSASFVRVCKNVLSSPGCLCYAPTSSLLNQHTYTIWLRLEWMRFGVAEPKETRGSQSTGKEKARKISYWKGRTEMKSRWIPMEQQHQESKWVDDNTCGCVGRCCLNMTLFFCGRFLGTAT